MKTKPTWKEYEPEEPAITNSPEIEIDTRFLYEAKREAFHAHDKYIESLEKENKILIEALKFYAPFEKWEEAISTGGLFDFMDGDQFYAFRDMAEGSIAREALKEIEK